MKSIKINQATTYKRLNVFGQLFIRGEVRTFADKDAKKYLTHTFGNDVPTFVEHVELAKASGVDLEEQEELEDEQPESGVDNTDVEEL